MITIRLAQQKPSSDGSARLKALRVNCPTFSRSRSGRPVLPFHQRRETERYISHFAGIRIGFSSSLMSQTLRIFTDGSPCGLSSSNVMTNRSRVPTPISWPQTSIVGMPQFRCDQRSVQGSTGGLPSWARKFELRRGKPTKHGNLLLQPVHLFG
jgi:hypothetical protein